MLTTILLNDFQVVVFLPLINESRGNGHRYKSVLDCRTSRCKCWGPWNRKRVKMFSNLRCVSSTVRSNNISGRFSGGFKMKLQSRCESYSAKRL